MNTVLIYVRIWLVRAECTGERPSGMTGPAFWHLHESYVCKVRCFSALSLAVLLGAVWAAGFAGYGEVLAIPAEAEFLTALAFLGGSYPPEISLLLVCELGLPSARGTLALRGTGSFLDGPFADFASARLGVASVGWHGEDENVVERTAYCPRVRGFLEYSQRRGFVADPARVRHPKDKPKVERSVSYVRERLFKGGEFDGLAHLRTEARRWCLEVAGQRVHGTTRQKPLVVFQDEERHALLPWDGEPYEITHWRTAKVHPDHHVACQYALYSVPASSCPPGQKVEIRLDSKLVRIYHRGKLVKVHQRQPKGGRATDVDDYPAELSAYTMKAPERIKRSAALLGPAVAEFAQRLFDDRHPWSKIRQGHKLIRLGDRYSAERLNAACQRALDVDLIDVNRVERILVQALEEETLPQLPLPIPAGRFARPGSVFALTAGDRS